MHIFTTYVQKNSAHLLHNFAKLNRYIFLSNYQDENCDFVDQNTNRNIKVTLENDMDST